MNETMKALVFYEPGKYGLADVPVPRLIEPTDVIAKVTLAAICTSDIHIVHGHVPSVPNRIMGHEFCAEVVEVGSAVQKLKVGDRCMVLPGASCFQCSMCKAGMFIFCEKAGMFGGGLLDGSQAEYLRIPWADRCMFPIPAGLTEEDVILLPDMLATAWFGIKNAELQEGQSVAIIGVGPVGQCACLLAKKAFGAQQVIAIDTLQDRLDLALKEGNADMVINPTTEDAAQKLIEVTDGAGVDCVIETPGFKQTLNLALTIAKPNGIISTVGVIGAPLEINMQDVIFKNLTIRGGLQKCEGVVDMMKMIYKGKIDTKFMLTHRAPLNDIEKGYDIFGNQKDGCMKWLITPYER